MHQTTQLQNVCGAGAGGQGLLEPKGEPDDRLVDTTGAGDVSVPLSATDRKSAKM